MSNTAFHVRRAIVDDLDSLKALWNSMHLPAGELERRLTEFQVAESDEGALLGAVGLEIIERQGRIHSEAFNDFAIADVLRAQLWERMHSVAVNRGLARLWTSETAPFWKSNGFHPADGGELKRLPPAWNLVPNAWFTMALRDEDALRASLDMDFNRLKQEGALETQRMLNKARKLKVVAIVLTFLVVSAAIAFCVNLLRHLPMFRR
ncbi:MAG TPA: hypothetical protein VG754_00060 [Verrucomicrobiae bacterium]|jgi:N-acetylglutamate synthase-like GNAT family acetyltransferase|nr:hypothetical protein [Verrucomicrobiae bacterium]